LEIGLVILELRLQLVMLRLVEPAPRLGELRGPRLEIRGAGQQAGLLGFALRSHDSECAITDPRLDFPEVDSCFRYGFRQEV
jgi:hypothetical protein